MPKSHWNYRVIEHPSPFEGEPPFLQIHEVHYRNNVPWGYSEGGANVCGDTNEEMLVVLERIKGAIEKPRLKAADFKPKT